MVELWLGWGFDNINEIVREMGVNQYTRIPFHARNNTIQVELNKGWLGQY